MSKLIDKLFRMRNLNDEELKSFIEILTNNEKNLIIFSTIKLLRDDEISDQIEL